MQTPSNPVIDTTFINLKSDWGFKRLFGSKERSGILKRLLNALFEGELVISDLTFEDKEVIHDNFGGKSLFYDVHCITTEGKHFIVEMQQREVGSFNKRMLFYAISAIYKQGVRGGGYDFNPVYLIAITNFSPSGVPEKLVNEVGLCIRNTDKLFSDHLRLFFISLAQVKSRWEECNTELERLTFIIKNMDKFTKDSKPYKTGEYSDIFDASEVSQMASEEAVDYAKSLLRMREMEELREEAKEEAREAREEGREEGLLSVVKNMFKNGMPLDQIAMYTDLSLSKIKTLLAT